MEARCLCSSWHFSGMAHCPACLFPFLTPQKAVATEVHLTSLEPVVIVGGGCCWWLLLVVDGGQLSSGKRSSQTFFVFHSYLIG